MKLQFAGKPVPYANQTRKENANHVQGEKTNNQNQVFLILFLIFTVLCWCPLGYGSYGAVGLIMGMPSWAFILLVAGAVLFAVEWVYLFHTDLVLYDENLDDIIAALQSAATPQPLTEES